MIHMDDLKKNSPIGIPKHFPSDQVRGMLPFIVEYMEKEDIETACWRLWFIIELQTNQFIGEIELSGKPANENRLCFSLSMIGEKYEKEYLGEALHGLIININKYNPLYRLETEILSERMRYKRLLEECGFRILSMDNSYCRMRRQ